MNVNINHRGGFVQVSPHGITAWSHGTMLGNHYKTIAGAKTAITRHHQQWVNDVISSIKRTYKVSEKIIHYVRQDIIEEEGQNDHMEALARIHRE